MPSYTVLSDQAVSELQHALLKLEQRIYLAEQTAIGAKERASAGEAKHLIATVVDEVGPREEEKVGTGRVRIDTVNTGNGERRTYGVEYDVYNDSTNTYAKDAKVQIVRGTDGWWIVPAGSSTPDGFPYYLEHESFKSTDEKLAYPYGVLRPRRDVTDTGENESMIRARTNHWSYPLSDNYQGMIVNGSSLVESESVGRGFRGTSKPIPIRLPSLITPTSPAEQKPTVGQVWGPLGSVVRRYKPSAAIDQQAVWQGLPGFRCVSEMREFEDHDGTTRYYALFVRDQTQPFDCVAKENWRRNSGGLDPYVVVHPVTIKPSQYLLSQTDFFTRHRDFIYNGSSELRPYIQVDVSLPINTQTHAPNIAKGQAFTAWDAHRRWSYPPASQGAGKFIATDDWWRDEAIGVIKLADGPSSSGSEHEERQGWELFTAMRGRLPTMSTTDGTFNNNLQTIYVRESSAANFEAQELREIRWLRRIDNSAGV